MSLILDHTISGIGRCLCEHLVRGGAEVFAISRTRSHLDALKAEHPEVHIFSQDLAKWSELKEILESLPVLDGVVNNAGINILEPLVEVSEQNWDE